MFKKCDCIFCKLLESGEIKIRDVVDNLIFYRNKNLKEEISKSDKIQN